MSGLFSYSDKSSSHIPRSLSQLLTDTSQLCSVIVCPIYKVTNYTDPSQTLTVNPCVLTVDSDYVGHLYNLHPTLSKIHPGEAAIVCLSPEAVFLYVYTPK